MKKVSKEEQNNNSNVLLVGGAVTNDFLCTRFNCKICDGVQTIQVSYYRANEIFPVCNECLKDLKNFMLSKRCIT